MATDPDTGVQEGDLIGRPVPGADQANYTHSDSGNSGASAQKDAGNNMGWPQAGSGAPEPTK